MGTPAGPDSRDRFGDRADDYARHRPTYPEALFDLLEQLAPGRGLVWDCGAGSGQAAGSLARRFARVVATDVSVRQLARAPRHERILRVAAAAEAAPLRTGAADLVTASASLHWFDRARFFAEVRRVARRGGIVAVWSYYHCRVDPDVDAVLVRYADDIVGPLWAPEMQLNRHAYRDLDFPFERLAWPAIEAEAHMRADDLMQYMRTWSASQAWERSRGSDPVAVVRDDLLRAWGDPGRVRLVRWPLHGAIGRV